jgi:GT2 family glycosyltransferase
MKSISFCIASAKNEKYYTLGVLDSLTQNTEFSNHEVLIFIDSDNQNTYEALLEYRKDKPNIKIYRNTSQFPVGSQRNVSIMFSQATKDIVIYLQSDMVVCPNFDKYFLEAIGDDKNKVVSAARIEPPLHPASPEKIVMDFGLTPEEFKANEFYKFTKDLQKENRPIMEGHFAPFGLYKETYFNTIGGFDSQFRCSREDSDFIIRIKTKGLETIQTWNASVYHYTCVSSRGTGWFKTDSTAEIKNQWQTKADQEELRRFIRKWGYFGHDYKPKYKTTLVLDLNTAPDINVLAQIEPYFDKIVLNDKTVLEQLISFTEFNSYYYANKRWNYTTEHWSEIRPKFMGPNLKDKFIYSQDYQEKDDVIIKLDYYSLIKGSDRENISKFIENTNSILDQLKENDQYQGHYQMDPFLIEVNNLTDTNQFHLDAPQYVFDTQEFKFV